MLPFGDKITDYFRKYQSAQSQLNGILHSLRNGQDELTKDNVALNLEKTNLWASMGRLNQYVYVAERLDTKLSARIAELELSDPEAAKALSQDVLFYVRQKHQDLLTQLAVSIQCYLAIDIIIKNNIELIKGVDRASTTTISALRTAVIVAQALGNQKLVLDQITALNTTTSGMIQRTSEMLRDNSAAIQEQAASSSIGIEQLQAAFANIYATMDSIDEFKLKALDSMSATIGVLETEVDKSRAYLDRVQTHDARNASGHPRPLHAADQLRTVSLKSWLGRLRGEDEAAAFSHPVPADRAGDPGRAQPGARHARGGQRARRSSPRGSYGSPARSGTPCRSCGTWARHHRELLRVATATDYLPEAVGGYLRLPRDWADTRPIDGYKTSLMVLVDQLELLASTMDKILDAANRADAQALIAHGMFLQAKFGTPSGPDLTLGLLVMTDTLSLADALRALESAANAAGVDPAEARAEGERLAATVAEPARGAYLDWSEQTGGGRSAEDFMNAASRGRRYRSAPDAEHERAGVGSLGPRAGVRPGARRRRPGREHARRREPPHDGQRRHGGRRPARRRCPGTRAGPGRRRSLPRPAHGPARQRPAADRRPRPGRSRPVPAGAGRAAAGRARGARRATRARARTEVGRGAARRARRTRRA